MLSIWMQKLFFCWVLQTFAYKILLNIYTEEKGKLVDFIFLEKKNQQGKTEFTSSGSVTNLFCNIAHDHLHVLFVFLFVLSVLRNSIRRKLALALCEFTVQFNCMCQFIQISLCTVITTKGDDVKNSDKKVNKRIYQECECEF